MAISSNAWQVGVGMITHAEHVLKRMIVCFEVIETWEDKTNWVLAYVGWVYRQGWP